MGSELAVLWIPTARSSTLNSIRSSLRRNPARRPSLPCLSTTRLMADYDDNPGGVFGTIKEPFSQGTQSCLLCHETGKTAKTRSEFFTEFQEVDEQAAERGEASRATSRKCR